MPTSESPHRMAWSRNVNGLSFASVSSHSDSFAISTASGFLSTPYRHRWATMRQGVGQPLGRVPGDQLLAGAPRSDS